MNPLCPNCQTELADDFGLVDCNSCGVVCSIDLEDNVTVQSEEPEIQEEVLDDSYADEAGIESLEVEGSVEESLEAEWSVDEPEHETENITGETEEGGRLPPAAEDLDSVDEPIVAAAPSLTGEDFLKELEVFSEEAAVDGGHIYYDFYVKGIEGGEQKENFIETLADSRLEISEEVVREMLGSSSDFSLPQVSFLRLIVIYKRLLFLGLEMSWSLSELQEPVSYISEEIEEADSYADDNAVYEETEDEY